MRRLTLVCIFCQLLSGISAIVLNDTIIASENDVPKLNYPNESYVSMHFPKVYALTKQMLLQLNSTTDFNVIGGVVPTVEMVPQFQKMSVFACKTDEVLIDPNVEYEIVHLEIDYNKLRAIPDNIKALIKLKKLSLSNNNIKYVDIEDFNGLLQLEKLNLASNKIVEISYPQLYSVSLPKLNTLKLDYNRLSFINFEHWDMPSLRYIDLHFNQLIVALFLSSQKFVNLRLVSLYDNPWNCQWLDYTANELKMRNVHIMFERNTTCKESIESLDEITRKIQFNEQSSLADWENPGKFRTQFHKLQKQILAFTKDSHKENFPLEVTLNHLKKGIENLFQNHSELQKNNYECKQETQKLRNDSEQIMRFEEKEKEKLNKSNEQLLLENNNLRYELNRANERNLDLSQSHAKLQEMKDELSDDNEKLRDDLEQTKRFEGTEKEKLKKSLQEITAQTEQLQGFCSELKDHVGQTVGILECLVKTSEMIAGSL